MLNKSLWSNVSVAAVALATTFMTPLAPPIALAAASPDLALASPASCANLRSVSLPNTTINSATDTPAELPPPIPGFPGDRSGRGRAASMPSSRLLERTIRSASTSGCPSAAGMAASRASVGARSSPVTLTSWRVPWTPDTPRPSPMRATSPATPSTVRSRSTAGPAQLDADQGLRLPRRP